MGPTVEFEDIEELRRQAGIEDDELRQQVRRLRVGDSVRLTAATDGDPGPRDRLLVLITNIRGAEFRGSLLRAASTTRRGLAVGSLLRFRASHIHSIIESGKPGIPPSAPYRCESRNEGTNMTPNRNTIRPTSKGVPATAALTTEAKIEEIGALLERVANYAKFMCRADGLEGTSPEARNQAISSFHERVVALERHLARVHDEFRLG